MKACAICGEPPERGSVCEYCRAALRRARDETISRFQPVGALAIAGGAALGRRNGASMARRAPRPAAAPTRARSVGAAANHGVSPEALPAGTPFVWVMVTLMVLVVTVVTVQVVDSALEAMRSRTQAKQGTASAADSPSVELPAPLPISPTPLAAGLLEPPAAVVIPERQPPASAPAARRHAPALRHPKVARPAAPKLLPPPPKAAPVAGAEASAEASPPKRLMVAQTAPAKAREPARSDRWAMMESALHACGRKDFLGRVVCEQKVRFDYCGGFWGQKAQCPGSPVNDHGQ